METSQTEELDDFVFHDGIYIKESQMLKMARNAGCYQTAEHYLLSLLAHSLLYGKTYMLDRLNEIRKFYQVRPIPNDMLKPECTPSKNGQSLDERARQVYHKLTVKKRNAVLNDSLKMLRINNANLFSQKIHWMGIYLVIRDRLDENLTQKGFYEVANAICPQEWPQELRIGRTTFTNLSRYITFKDRNEAYYDMTNNPWKDLCKVFWTTLKDLLLMNKEAFQTNARRK